MLVVAVPYEGHAELLRGLAGPLAGKIVVDAVNPLGFDKQGPYRAGGAGGQRRPAGGRAAAGQPGHRRVPPRQRAAAERPVGARAGLDVLVLGEGEDREATDTVQALAELIPGMRGVYAGRLRNAGQVEAFTANLISINRRYKAHAGIRVTDV